MYLTSLIAAAVAMVPPPVARGAAPSPAESAERDRWVAACFPGFEVPARPPAGELVVEQRYDYVLQNTYCDSRFLIGGRGSVVFTVDVAGERRFTSPVMRGATPAVRSRSTTASTVTSAR